MIVAKILAVLSAMLLVGAVAIGMLGPQDISLGDSLNTLDHLRFAAVQGFIRTRLSTWVWDHPIAALLARPPWMIPAILGVLAGGAAMTTASSRKAPNSRRRRS